MAAATQSLRGETTANVAHVPDAIERARASRLELDRGADDQVSDGDEVIACGPSRRPIGLVWADLPPEKIEAIPVLAAMRNHNAD